MNETNITVNLIKILTNKFIHNNNYDCYDGNYKNDYAYNEPTIRKQKNTIRMVKLEYHSLSIKYKTGRYIWYHQYAWHEKST